jgi:transcription-repair coupling factor (superfamily II helicase)
VDAGPRGAVVGFYRNQFANPEGLVQFVQASRGLIKVQPDQKLVFRAEWDLPAERLKGVRGFVGQLAGVASKAKKAA